MNDPHLVLLEFFPCSKDIFKDVAIADGLSIVLKNMEKNECGFTYKYSVDGKVITIQANNPGNDMFSLNPQDNEIIKRLDNAIQSFGCLHDSVLPRNLFSIESDFVEKNPSLVKEFNDGDYPKSVIRNFCEQKWPKFTSHTLIIAIIMAYFTQNGSPIF